MDTRAIQISLDTFKGRTTKVAHLSQDNISEFMTARFAHKFDRNAYLASGSTFEKEGELTTKPLEVLDASKITPLVAEGDRCKGFIMATADGYSHLEPSLIAAAAVEACDRFTSRASKKDQEYLARNNDITSILDFAGQSCESKEGSSLAGAIIKQKENQQKFFCEMGNVGDGMIVVIDGEQRKVRTIIGARQYVRQGRLLLKLTQQQCLEIARSHQMPAGVSNAYFYPMSIQDSQQTIAQEEIVLNPGDFVIHMTDGAWSEFTYKDTYFMKKGDGGVETELVEQKEASGKKEYVFYRESKIQQEEFENLLKEKNESSNSFELGQTLLNAALMARAKRQTQKQALLNWLEEKVQAEYKKHLEKIPETAIEENQPQNQKELRKKAENESLRSFFANISDDQKRYLQEFMKHQGIKEEGITLGQIIQQLKITPAGDCSTVAVVQVPNAAVENLRPFFERVTDKAKSINIYYAIQESTSALKKARDAWLEKKGEAAGENESGFYKTLIDHLRNEKRLLESTEKDYREGDVRQNVCSFYTPEEMKILTSDLIQAYIALGENKLLYSLDDKIEKKKAKQEALKGFLNQHCPSVHEKAVFFNFLEGINSYNAHANERWDRFFGVRNTKSWRATVKEIRNAALEKLIKEWEAIQDANEKIAFLKNARKMRIFSAHRNNSLFFGAFGRTNAQIWIDALIKQTEIDAKPERPRC
ncbi:MAG: hypothetical protein K0S63_39 [Gammaproteobacteria bacterium]|nr:hypothetical protein [Gammaproteobacteria bacterium]